MNQSKYDSRRPSNDSIAPAKMTNDASEGLLPSSSSSSRRSNMTLDERKTRSTLAVQAHADHHSILVSTRQRGNPLLDHIKNVPMEFNADVLPDYVVGSSSCCVFLSIRYHMLHPQYLIERMVEIGCEYRTRVVLCFVDTTDHEHALVEINHQVIQGQFSLILAWSWAEAGRYLETFKSYEKKSATLIKERIEDDYVAQLNDVLTTIRAVNKTDVNTLATTFGSLQSIMQASLEELSLCPGLGEKKVRNLYQVLHEPFRVWPKNTESSSGPPE